MQRHLPLIVSALVGLASAVVPVSAAGAAPPACQPGAIAAAIGIPRATVDGRAGAGAVEVRYACGHAPQLVHLPTPHAGDDFGRSIRSIDWNVDGYADLVVGVPGHDAGSSRDAGAVALFYGSASGLTFGRLLTQSTSGVPGTAQPGARFGSAVGTWFTIGDEPDPPARRIRVGEPDKDVDGAVDAGGFVDLVAGWPGHRNHEVTLDTAGYPGTARRGDRLGASLSDLGLVGAPGRTVDGHVGAGAVLVAYDSAAYAQFVSQDTPCVPGSPEAGDHFGASLAGSWIGVPGEDLGPHTDAGLVERWDGSGRQCAALTQSSPGVGGDPEAGDRFGAALGELFGIRDDMDYAPDALVIGVPGEDTSYGTDSGLVDVVAEFVDQETGVLSLASRGSTAGPAPHAHAAFGRALGVAGPDVLISAPGGTGAVDDYRLTQRKTLARQTTYHRVTGRAVTDGYGTSLSSATGY